MLPLSLIFKKQTKQTFWPLLLFIYGHLYYIPCHSQVINRGVHELPSFLTYCLLLNLLSLISTYSETNKQTKTPCFCWSHSELYIYKLNLINTYFKISILNLISILLVLNIISLLELTSLFSLYLLGFMMAGPVAILVAGKTTDSLRSLGDQAGLLNKTTTEQERKVSTQSCQSTTARLPPTTSMIHGCYR